VQQNVEEIHAEALLSMFHAFWWSGQGPASES